MIISNSVITYTFTLIIIITIVTVFVSSVVILHQSGLRLSGAGSKPQF